MGLGDLEPLDELDLVFGKDRRMEHGVEVDDAGRALDGETDGVPVVGQSKAHFAKAKFAYQSHLESVGSLPS